MRLPKISSAYALKFLTAAPSLARCFVHWTRFASLALIGEVFGRIISAPTVRASIQHGGCDIDGGGKVLLAQRSPRSLFASRFSRACAVPCSLFRPLGALTGYAPPYSKEQKVEHLIRRLTATPSSCGSQKFLRHSPYNRKRAPCVERLALRRYA